MKIILLLIIFLSPGVTIATDIPSEERVMEDYYHIYLGYEGHIEPDTSVYNITNNDYVLFPDLKEEERLGYNIIRTSEFDPSEVKINYYEGYYIDTIKPQCIVLISPVDFYPAGPAWGLPGSVLILYIRHNAEWKPVYACPFYHEAEPVILDEKSKLSLLFVRIDYGLMGAMQWLECLYRFNRNKPEEIYYELTSSNAMSEEIRYLENKSRYKGYQGGDTLGQVILKDEFSDIDDDGIKEMICMEELTISAKPRRGEFQMTYYFREKIYKYQNGQLVLSECGPFRRNENND